LSFLAGILLLFSGVEVQAVHAEDMKDPRRGFPRAIFIAAFACFAVFTLGALAVAGILPYDKITLQSGVFDAFTAPLTALGVSWAGPVIAALICYGALGGALAWLSGPSRALLVTAEDGALPPFLQRTNRRGAQRNILLAQGCIVTAISAVYLVMKNVSSAFFLISALVVGLYIIMYMLMFAAAIRLRYTHPDLPRNFRIPGGPAGMWAVAGTGFAAVAFALVLAFVPPSQLPIGNPASYVAIVAAGTILFTGLPLLIHRLRRPSWRANAAQSGHAGAAPTPNAESPS
jgi:amino acid transporter